MNRPKNRKEDDRLHMTAALDFGDDSFEITFRCKGYYSRIVHLGIIDKVKANDLLNVSRIDLKFRQSGLVDGLIKGDVKKRGITITDLFN